MAAGINLFAAAVLGVLVLIAQERLGLDDTGYGLQLSAAALGGLLGRVNLTAQLWASFIGLVLLAIAVAPVLTTATVREVLGRTTSTESHTT